MDKDLNKLSFSELKKEIECLEKEKEKATIKNKGIWQIGKNYLIRTVTMIQVGRLVEVTDKELVLENASWVADTGRFSKFLSGETDNKTEIEPFPDGLVFVGRGALVDCVVWEHELLRKVK